MAALDWLEVRGQMFEESEAREASDFQEILSNFNLEGQRLFAVFSGDPLTVAKRLVLAELVHLDGVKKMLADEKDDRIIKVIQKRLEEEQ